MNNDNSDHNRIFNNCTPKFILIPSLACNSNCSYCFGPNQGPCMDNEMITKVINYIHTITLETYADDATISLHGGEPLLLDFEKFNFLLNQIHMKFRSINYALSLQSNLWLLDKQWIELFRKNNITIGTSLDGPKEINDRQRGTGYFDKTMDGINTLRAHGIKPGCIVTVTADSLKNWKEIFDFFISQKLDFVFRPVYSSGRHNSPPSIDPVIYGNTLCDMFDYYIENRHFIRITTFDEMLNALLYEKSKTCSFNKCFGLFLSIDPYGDIYHCQRYGGNSDAKIGSILQSPSLAELSRSKLANSYLTRNRKIQTLCNTCEHIAYCNGGCPFPYNNGTISNTKDIYCESYKIIFNHVKNKLVNEVILDLHAQNGLSSHELPDNPGLLKNGPLLEIVNSKFHPKKKYTIAKKIIASYELARNNNDIIKTSHRLKNQGISKSFESAKLSLEYLVKSISHSNNTLQAINVMITSNCQINCQHCIINDNTPANNNRNMPFAKAKELLSQAAKIVNYIVITGGEPLLYPDLKKLLEYLYELKVSNDTLTLILKSNFIKHPDTSIMKLLLLVFDIIEISIDGDEKKHNEIRGKNTYQKTEHTIKSFLAYKKSLRQNENVKLAELSLVSIFQNENDTHIKNKISSFAHDLGIKKVRYRNLLPLGKKNYCQIVNNFHDNKHDSCDSNWVNFHPNNSCGLGKNLYISPNLSMFPCLAYINNSKSNINDISNNINLAKFVTGDDFKKFLNVTVDTNTKCKTCDVKYICGGGCKGINTQNNIFDPNAPLHDCTFLEKKALKILSNAKEYLNFSARNI